CQSLPQRRLKIMRMVGRDRRRRTASISPRDFVYPISSSDFFDKIDIALQIASIARDFPLRRRFGTRALLQSKPLQNFVDRLRLNRDADDSITFFVTQ